MNNRLILAARVRGYAVAFFLMGLLAGCAGVSRPLSDDMLSNSAEVRDCADWFARLDEFVDQRGLRDAETVPVAGFPYLRVNRFFASFADQAQSDATSFAVWEGHLRRLDARARDYEIANMPDDAAHVLGAPDRNAIRSRTVQCADVLQTRDAGDSGRRAFLFQQAHVPDDYADWKRVVGLYPLVKLPFFEFAKGWQNEAAEQFKASAAGGTQLAEIRRYSPAETPNAKAAAAVFARLRRDALGVPLINAADERVLLTAFAPDYEVETTGDYDRIGALHWGQGEAPAVDAQRPAAYSRIAFTRYGGRTLVQLVYLIWFSERPDAGWLDMLSGKLDGLIFRVTLDQEGQPLVYDSIHPCGCYHMFLPTPAAKPTAPPERTLEWAFIPRTLPAADASHRLVLRLNSRSHYLVDVRPEPMATAPAGASYALIDDSALRTLPTATGTRNVFGPDGIVPGTQRGERLVVWPLGISDPGAMREWGRHATALVGRRHFDDADLIEKRFDIPSLRAMANQETSRD